MKKNSALSVMIKHWSDAMRLGPALAVLLPQASVILRTASALHGTLHKETDGFQIWYLRRKSAQGLKKLGSQSYEHYQIAWLQSILEKKSVHIHPLVCAYLLNDPILEQAALSAGYSYQDACVGNAYLKNWINHHWLKNAKTVEDIMKNLCDMYPSDYLNAHLLEQRTQSVQDQSALEQLIAAPKPIAKKVRSL